MSSETTAKLINMSGKLRMLSHRICLFLSMGFNAEDESSKQYFYDKAMVSLDEFDKSYNAIAKEARIKANTSKLQKLLFDKNGGIHTEIDSFIKRVAEIHSKNQKNRSIDRQELEVLCLFTADRLLFILNDLTNSFQTDEENYIKSRRNQICDGLSQIESIGKRINLISFNAQIEAARAGEAGRGFSAISNEIQSLSVQTQVAAKSLRSVT